MSTPDSVSVSLNRERNVRECGRAVGKNNESLFHLRRDGTLRGRAATLPVAISVVVSEAMASSIATHAREAVASERGTRATRLGLTPARGDATGSQAADATKRGAPGAPVRRVVSEEDLEAAELMCSLRDVIEPPATRDVRRRRPADAPKLPSKLPAPRRTLPAPERRGMPKSAFGEGAKNKRGIGRVESLLTRARGVARQLAPPFPALKRCGSITEALAYIDAQPPSGAPVDGRERRLPKKRRREPSREETPKSPFPTPPSPRSVSRERVPPRVPSPPGTPTERPTPKPLGTVRAFLARGGALLASLDAKVDGASAAIPSSENADEDGEENADGENGDEKVSTPKRRKLPTRSLAEPGCARARPFVRRGDVGDEDVALYLPDAGDGVGGEDDHDDDDDDLLLVDPKSRCVGDPGARTTAGANAFLDAWRWTTPQRAVTAPRHLLHDPSDDAAAVVKRLMLPCVVAAGVGDGMRSRRAADAANAFDSASRNLLETSRRPPKTSGGDGSMIERRRLRSDERRLSGSKRTSDKDGPPALTTPANPPSPMTKAAKDRALTAAYAACKAIAPTFRVDRSRIHGLGVYSTVPLPAKCAALEYVGEIISDAVADAREATATRSIVDAAKANGRVATPAELARASTYMFALDPGAGTVVDAAREGNATRFVNHCCEPNCYTRVVVVGGEKKILLFTSRDVAAGEELTYDYMFKPDVPENEAPCDCGADKCRGIINVR